jgi:hypothetical protein
MMSLTLALALLNNSAFNLQYLAFVDIVEARRGVELAQLILYKRAPILHKDVDLLGL